MPKNPSAEDMARFTKYGKKEGVDPHLLASIAYQESRFKNKAVSPSDARGMFQFIPSTAKDYGVTDVNDLHDPEISTRIAAKHVAKLQKRYPNEPWKVLAAYNTGPRNVDRYGKGVLGPNWNKRKNAGETGDYVKKIMADYDRRSSGKRAKDETKRIEDANELMREFVEVSHSLGMSHGMKQKEKKEEEEEAKTEKPRSRPRKPAGDKIASPRLQAAMRKQQEERVATRKEKSAWKKNLDKQLKQVFSQAEMAVSKDNKFLHFTTNKNNPSYDNEAMARIKEMLGPEQDEAFRSLSALLRSAVSIKNKKLGEKEAKAWKEKSNKVLTNFLGDVALTVATAGTGTMAKTAYQGMTAAARVVGSKGARAGWRAAAKRGPDWRKIPDTAHGPLRAQKIPKDVKPPRTGKLPKTGKDKEAEFLIQKYGPPKGPARAPISRRLEAGGRRALPESKTRYAGPSSVKKPKLLRAHKEKPGEALSKMRDSGKTWKEVAEETGITVSQARSAVRRFRGTHKGAAKTLGLSGKPTKKLADFLRNEGMKSKDDITKNLNYLVRRLQELGMPQRARELKSLR